MQDDADERWRYYEQLAGMHRRVPHTRIDEPGVAVEIETSAGPVAAPEEAER